MIEEKFDLRGKQRRSGFDTKAKGKTIHYNYYDAQKDRKHTEIAIVQASDFVDGSSNMHYDKAYSMNKHKRWEKFQPIVTGTKKKKKKEQKKLQQSEKDSNKINSKNNQKTSDEEHMGEISDDNDDNEESLVGDKQMNDDDDDVVVDDGNDGNDGNDDNDEIFDDEDVKENEDNDMLVLQSTCLRYGRYITTEKQFSSYVKNKYNAENGKPSVIVDGKYPNHKNYEVVGVRTRGKRKNKLRNGCISEHDNLFKDALDKEKKIALVYSAQHFPKHIARSSKSYNDSGLKNEKFKKRKDVKTQCDIKLL